MAVPEFDLELTIAVLKLETLTSGIFELGLPVLPPITNKSG